MGTIAIDRLGSERWGIHEIVITAPEAARTANPFLDVACAARFADGRRTIRVRAFYDGDAIWRIRFMPPDAGRWTWVTESDAPGLGGLSGELTAAAPAAGNHGPVQAGPGRHFAHADGSRHQSFGTTCYGWIHQPLERQEETLRTLAASPFNKLRMCVFPKYYEYHRDPPLHHVFARGSDGGLDWGRPELPFYRLLDQRLTELAGLGIEADLILFHPYDKDEAGERWGYQTMPAWAEDAHLRYLVARVGAFRNVWWSLANEWDFMRGKTLADWHRHIRVIGEEDPYRHLLSIHNGTRMFDHADPAITHVSAQRIDVYRTTEDTIALRDRYAKPVVWDEVAYEGDVPQGWGNITAEELVRRCWEGTVRGGYVGHGETYVHPRDILWWSRGGVLHGQSAPRIAFLRAIAESCPGPGIEPLPGEWDVPTGGSAGAWTLTYFGFMRPRWRMVPVPTDADYAVEVIDTWNMTRTPVPGRHRGALRVELPGRPYMAVLARRLDPAG